MIQDKLRKKAKKIIDDVADNPHGRLQLRKNFYQKFGQHEGCSDYGFGNSEIDFIEWEIKRGTLNPMDGSNTSGSPWWRNINGQLIYYSELADLAQEEQITDWEWPVQAWLNYFKNPKDTSWYMAHNSSISAGYLRYNKEALQENIEEQVFMNIVLYRLFYAQAMVERATFFGRIGDFLANPTGDAVDWITHLPHFYPDKYPLDNEQLDIILRHTWLDRNKYFKRLIELFMPFLNLDNLYTKAAGLDQTPEILTLLHQHKPAYPDRSVSKYFT